MPQMYVNVRGGDRHGQKFWIEPNPDGGFYHVYEDGGKVRVASGTTTSPTLEAVLWAMANGQSAGPPPEPDPVWVDNPPAAPPPPAPEPAPAAAPPPVQNPDQLYVNVNGGDRHGQKFRIEANPSGGYYHVYEDGGKVAVDSATTNSPRLEDMLLAMAGQGSAPGSPSPDPVQAPFGTAANPPFPGAILNDDKDNSRYGRWYKIEPAEGGVYHVYGPGDDGERVFVKKPAVTNPDASNSGETGLAPASVEATTGGTQAPAPEDETVTEPDPPADEGEDTEAAGVSDGNTHTVVEGDTLWQIAQDNDMSLEELVALNPQIKNPNLILPGEQVNLGVEGDPSSGPADGVDAYPVSSSYPPTEKSHVETAAAKIKDSGWAGAADDLKDPVQNAIQATETKHQSTDPLEIKDQEA